MDERHLTRRELFALLGAGALGGALSRQRMATPGVSRAGIGSAPRAMPFELADVRLLDGPFREAQQRNLRYLLSLDADRLLHNFRVNAGLQPKAPVYGGWESEEPWVGIRCHGHTLGHYLGAVSMTYAATGDAECGRRAAYIVSELRACQQARGDGLVCAFPDGSKPLDDAVAGRSFAGVPWYTMHKVFAGLRDAHVCAATPGALAALVALADWTDAATRDMSDAEMQRMLDTEHGGMTEVLADVASLAGEPKYLALAQRFAHQRVLVPLSQGRDVLDGMHSNTQIPKFVGYQRVNELGGDAAFGSAARNFWTTVVERRSYATGGNGDGEHFFPIAEFARRLGSAKTMETCCTHNMLRLTRALFADEPSASYADYYERALYNGILASQDPESGMMTYFQATRPGYVRLFNTPDRSFWCCTGTGMENHAKYGDSIYFRDGDSLRVNLFIPSRLTWKERGLVVTQRTRFPEAESTRLTIDRVDGAGATRATVMIRRPQWCTAMSVSVNGRRWRDDADATGYVLVRRDWRTGDVVDVRLPMTLRTEALPAAPDYVAFFYGPIVLAGRLGTRGLTPGSQIIVNERTSGSMLNDAIEVPTLVGAPHDVVRQVRPMREPLTFETVGLGRPADVQLAPFYRLAHERYNLYWKVQET